MKLFVWKDVLEDYTAGMMFAIAKDVNGARLAIYSEHEGWAAPRAPLHGRSDHEGRDKKGFIGGPQYKKFKDLIEGKMTEAEFGYMSRLERDLLKEPEVFPVTKKVGFYVYGGG